jgi:membrane-associated phospholipid phosphatase
VRSDSLSKTTLAILLPMGVSAVLGHARSRRGLPALGVTLLVPISALTFDHHVASWAVQSKCAALDALIAAINPIGGGVTLLLACMILSLLCRPLRWLRLQDAAALGALAFATAGLLQFSLKHLVGRPRPDAGVASAALLGPSFAQGVDSFPSGHATSVFAVATVFAAYYPRLRWMFYGLASAIALGRVYLERHYVSDILAGAIIGTLVAVYFLTRRRVRLRRLALAPLDGAGRDRGVAGLEDAEPVGARDADQRR